MTAASLPAWPVSLNASGPVSTVGASCRHCKDVLGIPYAVAVRAAERTVSFRCPACEGTWARTAPDLPAFWSKVSQ